LARCIAPPLQNRCRDGSRSVFYSRGSDREVSIAECYQRNRPVCKSHTSASGTKRIFYPTPPTIPITQISRREPTATVFGQHSHRDWPDECLVPSRLIPLSQPINILN